MSEGISGALVTAAPQSRQARLERLDQANSVVVSRLRELSRERALLRSGRGLADGSLAADTLAADLAHEAEDVTDLLCRHLAQLHNTVALEVRGVRARAARAGEAGLVVVPPGEGPAQGPSPQG